MPSWHALTGQAEEPAKQARVSSTNSMCHNPASPGAWGPHSVWPVGQRAVQRASPDPTLSPSRANLALSWDVCDTSSPPPPRPAQTGPEPRKVGGEGREKERRKHLPLPAVPLPSQGGIHAIPMALWLAHGLCRQSSGVLHFWGQVLSLPLSGCETLGKLWNLSELLLLTNKIGMTLISAS